MTVLTSSSWLPFWECLEFISIIVVGIGCWGERWSEDHEFSVKPEPLMPDEYTTAKRNGMRKKFERKFWLMVVWGLALELVSFGFAFLASNNEILELQAKLSPRAVTAMQVKTFMFLMEKVPKIPIRIQVGVDDGEIGSYAFQIRSLLDAANFPKDSTVDNSLEYTTKPTFSVVRMIGGKEEWPDVFFLAYSTNGQLGFTTSGFAYMELATNGLYRPVVLTNDTALVYGAIKGAFDELGIKTAIRTDSQMLKPGEWAIFIPPKNE